MNGMSLRTWTQEQNGGSKPNGEMQSHLDSASAMCFAAKNSANDLCSSRFPPMPVSLTTPQSKANFMTAGGRETTHAASPVFVTSCSKQWLPSATVTFFICRSPTPRARPRIALS